jgi:hypothetical protein
VCMGRFRVIGGRLILLTPKTGTRRGRLGSGALRRRTNKRETIHWLLQPVKPVDCNSDGVLGREFDRRESLAIRSDLVAIRDSDRVRSWLFRAADGVVLCSV